MNPQAPPFTPSAKSKANLQDKMAHYDGLLSGCGAFGCLYHGLSGCNTSKVSMGGAMFNGGKEAPGAGAAKFSSVTDEAPRTGKSGFKFSPQILSPIPHLNSIIIASLTCFHFLSTTLHHTSPLHFIDVDL